MKLLVPHVELLHDHNEAWVVLVSNDKERHQVLGGEEEEQRVASCYCISFVVFVWVLLLLV